MKKNREHQKINKYAGQSKKLRNTFYWSLGKRGEIGGEIENEQNPYLKGYWQLSLLSIMQSLQQCCFIATSCHSYKLFKALKSLKTMMSKLTKIPESGEKFRSRLRSSCSFTLETFINDRHGLESEN